MKRERESKEVSNLVFYAQSTIAVISQRERVGGGGGEREGGGGERERERERENKRT